MQCETSNGCTDDFTIYTMGLRRVSLSPTLFGIFINDLVDEINYFQSMGITINYLKLCIIMYAADVVFDIDDSRKFTN